MRRAYDARKEEEVVAGILSMQLIDPNNMNITTSKYII